MTHKDKFGIPLKIGDAVAYSSTYYKALYWGKVTKFTPKRVYIDGSQCKPEEVMIINDQIEANKVNHPEVFI